MIPLETERPERAILVGVVTRHTRRPQVEEYLDELQLLTESAGAVIVGRIVQERVNIDAATFIGSGKVEELSLMAIDTQADLVVFDDDLSAVQVRNLEKSLKGKIVDRSGIILAIFASRARTSEAKSQVELAQLEYMLPRLTRQWTHLSRVVGGIGTKGPGETQIETDRRVIRNRISHLKERLKEIQKERATQRKGREAFPRVALVGYTNVGKSTLLNWFTNAGVLVEDRLFATLDSTVRMVELSASQRILLSDTVGFIRKLPHQLVASFKSTLEEAATADLLLHVVDVSHPLFEEQITVVNETLEEIGAGGKPTIMVFNKIDRLTDRTILQYLGDTYPKSVFVSAWRGMNLSGLRDAILTEINDRLAEYEVTLTQQQHHLVSRIHDIGEVLDTKYTGARIKVRFRAPRHEAESLLKSIKERRT
jgi:GTP-binding protein HflX